MMGRFSRITRKPEDDAFAMPDAAHDKYIGCEDEEDEEEDEHENDERVGNEYVPEDNPGGRELEANLQPLIGDLFASNLNRKLNRKCYHPEQSSPGLLSPAF